MTTCPICGATAEPAFRSRFVEVHRCGEASCGHLFAAGVDARHGVMHEQGGDGDAQRYAERNERLLEFWERRGFVSPVAKILDVGAGAGHLAASLRARFPDAPLTCIEASEPLAARLRAAGFHVVPALRSLPPDAAFDAVVLIEVIEHVPEPVALLRRLGRHLAPGGRIFLTTPCGELRTGSRRTNAYDTPEHVHFFTERSLARAVREAGLDGFGAERIDALYPRPRALFSLGRAKHLLRRAALPVLERFQGPRHLTGFVAPPRAD